MNVEVMNVVARVWEADRSRARLIYYRGSLTTASIDLVCMCRQSYMERASDCDHINMLKLYATGYRDDNVCDERVTVMNGIVLAAIRAEHMDRSEQNVLAAPVASVPAPPPVAAAARRIGDLFARVVGRPAVVLPQPRPAIADDDDESTRRIRALELD